MPISQKKNTPNRRFISRCGSTSRVINASSPTPLHKTKTRGATLSLCTCPTSIERTSASTRRCAAVSRSPIGSPISFAHTFAVPTGKTPRAVSESTKPFATSLTVPSPPTAITASNFSVAASRANRVASPEWAVSEISTDQPRATSTETARFKSSRKVRMPADGL